MNNDKLYKLCSRFEKIAQEQGKPREIVQDKISKPFWQAIKSQLDNQFDKWNKIQTKIESDPDFSNEKLIFNILDSNFQSMIDAVNAANASSLDDKTMFNFVKLMRTPIKTIAGLNAAGTSVICTRQYKIPELLSVYNIIKNINSLVNRVQAGK